MLLMIYEISFFFVDRGSSAFPIKLIFIPDKQTLMETMHAQLSNTVNIYSWFAINSEAFSSKLI